MKLALFSLAAAALLACGDNQVASSTSDLQSFSFTSAANPSLTADVQGTINGHSVLAIVPNGTDVTKLVASFQTNGQHVEVSGTTQQSGVTPNDFTAPIVYRVVAQDFSHQDYAVTVRTASQVAKELSAFGFRAADNPSLSADVDAVIVGNDITATVPFGTDVTALIATYMTTGVTVRVGGVTQASGTSSNDFSNPVIYTVVAADGSTRDYTVTITVAPSSAKDITQFAFLTTHNPPLAADVTAVINGTAIAATVPFGTDVTALVATFSDSGVSVTVGVTPQVSSVTANDFTSAVVYHVTAADGSTKDYTVTVTIAPNTAKDITAFSFTSANNAQLSQDVVATITGTSIAATVPFGTDVHALIATFTTTGQSVTVGGATQTSDQTANDFTSPVVYTVQAQDASTKDFTVTVTIAPSPAKDITSFEFKSTENSQLAADVVATITGTSITATVPFGTNVTALVASFQTTGQSVTIGTNVQTSDVTANDFSAPLTYTVHAADGTTQDYTVTVTVAANPAKDITAFQLKSSENPSMFQDAVGTINGTMITVNAPLGTNVTALVASFSTTGQSVTVGTTAQTSDITPNDFTMPVVYTVHAADGTTKDYNVIVAVDPGATLTGAISDNGTPVAGAAVGIVGTPFATTADGSGNYTLTVPTSQVIYVRASLTGYQPAQTVAIVPPAGARADIELPTTAAVGAIATALGRTFDPANGILAVPFQVVARNGGETATITVSSDASFTLDSTGAPVVSTQTLQNGQAILIFTNVAPPTSGTLTIGPGPQESCALGIPLADYRIDAGVITEINAICTQSSANAITSFQFLAADNPSLSTDVTATISGTTVTANVPIGPNIGALVATFATTGLSVTVGSTVQQSGTTANDFTSPVTYAVHAADGSIQSYAVTVNVTGAAPLSGVVRDNGTGVAGATVTVLGTQLSTITDATGAFAMQVPAGSPIYVRASAANHLTTQLLLVVPTSGATDNIDMPSDADVSNVSAALGLIFDPSKGVFGVHFTVAAQRGGESAVLAAAHDAPFTFDTTGAPKSSTTTLFGAQGTLLYPNTVPSSTAVTVSGGPWDTGCTLDVALASYRVDPNVLTMIGATCPAAQPNATSVATPGYSNFLDVTPNHDGTQLFFIATTGGAPVVASVNSDGTGLTTVATGFTLPTAIAISDNDAMLFVADPGVVAPAIEGVYSVSASGGTPALVAGTGGFHPEGLAVSGTTLYFVGSNPATGMYGAYSVPTIGGAVTVIHEGAPLNTPTGIAVRPNGDVYVGMYPGGSNASIVAITSGGTATTFTSTLPPIGRVRVAIDSSDDSVWAADLDTLGTHDAAWRFALAGAQVSLQSSNGLSAASAPIGLHRASAAEVFGYADNLAGIFVLAFPP